MTKGHLINARNSETEKARCFKGPSCAYRRSSRHLLQEATLGKERWGSVLVDAWLAGNQKRTQFWSRSVFESQKAAGVRRVLRCGGDSQPARLDRCSGDPNHLFGQSKGALVLIVVSQVCVGKSWQECSVQPLHWGQHSHCSVAVG